MKKSVFLIFILSILGCAQEDQEKVDPITPKPEYTATDAAEWEPIKSDHLPIVDVNIKEKTIHVIVPGKTFDTSHYIEKIGIMDRDKVDLAVKSFDREEKPETTIQLKSFPEDWKHTKIYVKCNLHDLWTTTLEEEIEKTRKRERDK